MPLIYSRWIVSDQDALAAVLAFDTDTLVNYDFAGSPDGTGELGSDRVDVTDIGRLIASQMVGMRMATAAEIIRKAKGAPWGAVPIGARLEDAAPGTALYEATCDLLDHLDKILYVGAAIATKLLGLKRPQLIPVIDDRVWIAYTEPAAEHRRRGIRWPRLAAIRDDVCEADNVSGLETLRENLREGSSPTAELLVRLPDLRLRDVVFWQRWQLTKSLPVTEGDSNRVPW